MRRRGRLNLAGKKRSTRGVARRRAITGTLKPRKRRRSR